MGFDCDSAVSAYLAGEHITSIARRLHVREKSVSAVVRAALGVSGKLKRRDSGTRARMVHWDLDFFDRQNETVAYWAGFMMADGNVFSSKFTSSVRITIHEKDTDHLRAFCRAIGLSEEKVFFSNREPTARVAIHWMKLAEQLRPWGIVPNKTYNYVRPEVPDALLAPYLRGWADGDGYVSRRRGKERFRVTGNRDAVRWYGEALTRVGYGGRVGYELPEGAAWGKVVVNGRLQVERVVSLLCPPGCFRLERRWA